MRKSIATPPLNNQSHRRNAVVERVCRLEATPLPAALIRLRTARSALQKRFQPRKQFCVLCPVHIGFLAQQERINQRNRTLLRCRHDCEQVTQRITPSTRDFVVLPFPFIVIGKYSGTGWRSPEALKASQAARHFSALARIGSLTAVTGRTWFEPSYPLGNTRPLKPPAPSWSTSRGYRTNIGIALTIQVKSLFVWANAASRLAIKSAAHR
jgi:hypothetical protein